MPNPENVIGKGNRFTSENQPEHNGRKKNLFNWLKEDYQLSQSDVNNIIDYISMMSQVDFENMLKKIKDKQSDVMNMPVILVKFFEAYDKAKLDDVIKILKASGKATDKTEVSAPDGIEIIYRNKTKSE